MKPHKSEVEKAFRAMSYMAKEVDRNGIEMAFASRPLDVYKNTHTSKLSTKLLQHSFKHPPDTMELNMDTFVRYWFIRRSEDKKPIHVIIFTDGQWGGNVQAAAGVERPIEHLMGSLARRGVSRMSVMPSFIRFGNSEEGKDIFHTSTILAR